MPPAAIRHRTSYGPSRAPATRDIARIGRQYTPGAGASDSVVAPARTRPLDPREAGLQHFLAARYDECYHGRPGNVPSAYFGSRLSQSSRCSAPGYARSGTAVLPYLTSVAPPLRAHVLSAAWAA